MSAFGYLDSNEDVGNLEICMVQCTIGDSHGAMWQQVGECLRKKVKEITCLPQYIEQADNDTLI